MTPAQIAAVEETFGLVDLEALADDFYRLAFAADPALLAMFVSDPGEQRDRFATELVEIVAVDPDARDLRAARAVARAPSPRIRRSVRSLQGHGRRAHRGLRDAVGEAWTPDVEEAWRLAYNLTAETMMLGALGEEPSTRRR